MAELTVQDVRRHLSDYSPKNFLIEDEEFSEDEINLAITLALSSFNETPPVLTGFNKLNIPDFIKDTLLTGVIAKLYRGKAFAQERNRLSYADGGIQVAVSDRGQFYLTAAQQLQADFEQKCSRFKAWINIHGAFGNIESFYAQWVNV